jgi:hypothetical protein
LAKFFRQHVEVLYNYLFVLVFKWQDTTLEYFQKSIAGFRGKITEWKRPQIFFPGKTRFIIYLKIK